MAPTTGWVTPDDRRSASSRYVVYAPEAVEGVGGKAFHLTDGSKTSLPLGSPAQIVAQAEGVVGRRGEAAAPPEPGSKPIRLMASMTVVPFAKHKRRRHH